MENILWEDFKKIDIRTGTIIEALDFPEAIKPAYKLKVDLGEEIGIKNTSAQISSLYKKNDLINKQVLVVVNFPPKKIGPFISECLILESDHRAEITLKSSWFWAIIFFKNFLFI